MSTTMVKVTVQKMFADTGVSSDVFVQVLATATVNMGNNT